MTTDARSRRIVLVSHCLLNQSAKVQGLAEYPGVFEPVAAVLFREGAGLIQLPCPEAVLLGPERPAGTDTKEQYDTPEYRETCRTIAGRVAAGAAAYRKAGVAIPCLLGVEGSPSCSVDSVPQLGKDGERVLRPGMGIFMEILGKELEQAGLQIPKVGIPEKHEGTALQAALDRIVAALRKENVYE
jgi:predicted secreted protein